MKTTNKAAGETAKKRTIKESALIKKLGAFREARVLGANQTELIYKNGKALQSYNTIVAYDLNWDYYFTAAHDCSNTTNKHVKRWCGWGSPERRQGLANGKFINVI